MLSISKTDICPHSVHVQARRSTLIGIQSMGPIMFVAKSDHGCMQGFHWKWELFIRQRFHRVWAEFVSQVMGNTLIIRQLHRVMNNPIHCIGYMPIPQGMVCPYNVLGCHPLLASFYNVACSIVLPFRTFVASFKHRTIVACSIEP